MDFQPTKRDDQLLQQLEAISPLKRLHHLQSLDDASLWWLFHQGFDEALTILFKNNHREILVRTYARCQSWLPITLIEVQDAMGIFFERVISGKYESVELKKNFQAFAIYHVTFLVRSGEKRRTQLPTIHTERMSNVNPVFDSQLQLERVIDLKKVIDYIPKIPNHLYRRIIYLIVVLDYTSRDLVRIFGHRDKAYDKKYRAMVAFRKVLEKEGIWKELS